jgi:site-specific DNA-methyltransferase (adenine-specific)
LRRNNKDPHPVKLIRSLRRGRTKIYCADALDLLKSLPAKSAAIVFLDPPFNLDKSYIDAKHRDLKPQDEYTRWITLILDEVPRVLVEGGALFLYHLPFWALRFGSDLCSDLEFRHWIAISMKNGFARGKKLYPAHYALLYLTKGEPRYFSRPRIRAKRCRHCGEVIKDYGGYWPVIRRKGLNLSDLWEDISPVRHVPNKSRKSNELPPLLVDRIIAIAGRKNGLFVDPFCGSGAAVVAASNRGMKVIAGDISATYAGLTAERVKGEVSTRRRRQ